VIFKEEANMLNYIMDNLINIALLIFLLVWFYPKLAIRLNKNVKNISAIEVEKLIKDNKNIVILDVRTQNEYNSGYINGSKLMPVSEINSRLEELEKYRDRPILVHCASGGRSPKAVGILLKNKFGPIYHMNHGLSGWKGQLKR
jgi:rhodanese-related sulfurtransferase